MSLSAPLNFFYFVVEPDKSRSDGFGIIAGHPLQRDGYFEHVVYPFKDISLLQEGQTSQLLAEESAMRVYFRNDKTFTVHRIQRSLSSLGDEFIIGNIMYMEIGFYSTGFPFNTRHARVWLTIEDPPIVKENYSYDNSVNPVLIAGIVFFVLIFVGIITAVVLFLCERPPEIDDRLVPKAQAASKKPKVE